MKINGKTFKPTRGRCLLELQDNDDVMSRTEEVSNWMKVIAIGEPLDIKPEFNVGDTVYMAIIKGKQVIGDDGDRYLVTHISAIDMVPND
jgi:co-chaperonin GroES (HSP10)